MKTDANDIVAERKRKSVKFFFLIKNRIPFFATVILLAACSTKEVSPPVMFTLMDSTGINFRNDVVDTRDDNGFLFRNFYNGGGVATGDINNDGLADVFFTSNQGENKLYLNKGNFKFDDISAKAGLKQDSMWSTGATMVDINADGWLDIYVCNSGHIKDGNRKNKLYINNRNNTFGEAAKEYGLDISGYCTQASFLDYDMDGDLDCFIINNSPIPFSSLDYAGMRDVDVGKWNVDEKLKGGGNHLYRNNYDPNYFGPYMPGKPYFSEVTKQAGLHTGLISFGLGVSIGDINNDGYPDIYVGNDFIEKDYLYINQENGLFKDELEERIQKISMSSMSSDLADINNDGHPEIFTTDMIPDDDYRLKTTGTFDNIDLYLSKQKAGLYHQYVRNCLQLNNGNGSFSEIGNYSGVHGTDWSWGSVFFDADNDGLNDIFICNGIAKDVGDLDFLDFFSNDVYAKMMETGQRMEMDELLKHIPVTPLPNRVFKNKNHLQFEDVGKAWGLDQPAFSNSVAYADLDNDGDLDMVVNNENSTSFVYRNNTNQQLQNNFIAVELKGNETNTFAIGSKIKLFKNGQVFYRELFPVRGFQSSMEYKQTIGLGKNTFIDSMIIIWPDRTYTKYNAPQLNKLHILDQPVEKGSVYEEYISTSTLFETIPAAFDKHTEDDYVDFYYERNLPEQLSREGPHIANGDVNGDGLDDLYIGGAKHQAGQLYIQTTPGAFKKTAQPVLNEYKDFEDVAVLFFDADKDKDLDLFIGAGGNNVQPGGREIQHRLYVNDGKGNFGINTRAFPLNNMNIATVAANDFDNDGDEDLFVGSRSVPYSYGSVPQSYIYVNDGSGVFSEATTAFNSNGFYPGMITSALWANVTGDANKELIVTGQWMTTKVFRYANKKFEEIKNTGLQNLFGWWQSVSAADVNGDGLQDLIIGNVGENFYLRPALDEPAKLWVADFDGNGTTDQFLTRNINGKDMPVFLKRDITDQFPFLKKDNLRHSDYAAKSINDLFSKTTLSSALVSKFNYCQSVVAINSGNGTFAVKPLPLRVQLSGVRAICASDVNADGKVDLLLGGNLFTFPPQFGRLDASYGDVLMNDGKGNFAWMNNVSSGLNLRGEVKDIKQINGTGKTNFLITQNNNYPVLYQLKK